MPIVEIKMWSGRTEEQKEKLAQEVTKLFVDVAKTTPEHMHIIFHDIDKENWAIAGKLSHK